MSCTGKFTMPCAPSRSSSPSASAVLDGSLGRGAPSSAPCSQPGLKLGLHHRARRAASAAARSRSRGRRGRARSIASRIALIPVAPRPRRRRRRNLHFVGVDEQRHARLPATDCTVARSQSDVGVPVRRGPGVVVEVRALVVVERDRDDVVGVGLDETQRVVQPLRGFAIQCVPLPSHCAAAASACAFCSVAVAG